MDLQELAALGDRNLAAAWQMLGSHGGFALGSSDTVTFTSARLPIPFFNGAFTAARTSDPSRVAADALAFFGALGVPFLVWVREGVDDALLDACAAAGLRDAGGPPAMVLPEIGPVPAPPAGLELRLATTLDDLEAHRAVVAGGFGMPIQIAGQILGEGLLTEPSAGIVVGWCDGEPVTTALLATSGPTAGVYNVATLESFRGRGFGAAATWAVIAEGARRGCTHSVLQSSTDGYPVYRSMGFVDVGQCRQMEGPP